MRHNIPEDFHSGKLLLVLRKMDKKMGHGAISHLQVLKIWGDEGKIIKGRRRICRDTLRNFLNRLCPISIVMMEPQP